MSVKLAKLTGINRVSWAEYIKGQTDPFEKSGRIQREITDCLLYLLVLLTPQGVTLSCKEIADFCGISKQRVHQIEKEALRKLRKNQTLTKKDFCQWK